MPNWWDWPHETNFRHRYHKMYYKIYKVFPYLKQLIIIIEYINV